METTPAIRAFVCVSPPADVADEIGAYAESCRERPGFRWVARGRHHITLKFLGEIGAELITRLDTNFSRLGGVPPFGITVSGLGAFPSLARASVLWLGVSEGAEALTKLAAFAERLAVKAGCAAERRKFHPHMSLARARGGPLDAGSPPFVPPGKYSWTCREFTLMKSELTPSGPVYSPLRGYSLG